MKTRLMDILFGLIPAWFFALGSLRTFISNRVYVDPDPNVVSLDHPTGNLAVFLGLSACLCLSAVLFWPIPGGSVLGKVCLAGLIVGLPLTVWSSLEAAGDELLWATGSGGLALLYPVLGLTSLAVSLKYIRLLVKSKRRGF